jgi:cytochrome bd ubiquinol oxidase subunit I
MLRLVPYVAKVQELVSLFTGDPVIYSRILTAVTLAFHIIFATVGVGVPIMIALAEWTGIRRKDYHYILLARRWARGFVITVAIGVVTGTAIGLQLSLLWPSFMKVAGQSIAVPLFMETFAFFVEAIFLGIYLYTWDRFKSQKLHLLLLIPVAIGSSASAVFITMVNSFMNAPRGFRIVDGELADVQPLVAMFNPATPTKVAHVLASAYMTSAFVLAAIAAFSVLKNRSHPYYRKALHLTMMSAFIFSVTTAIVGDLSGKYLAKYQPAKLAAAEWHFETMTKAPLLYGGILTEEHRVVGAIHIPYALSILAHGNPSSEVIGLDRFPEDEIPPLFVHYLFDGMVTIGGLLTVISLLYVLGMYWRKWSPFNRTLLWSILISGPLSFVAIELGWIYAEVGRQPWILVGYMKTAQGATTSEHVGLMLLLFILLYAILGFTCLKVLRKLFRNYPVEEEISESMPEGEAIKS